MNNKYIEKYLKIYDDGVMTLGELDSFLCKGLKTKDLTVEDLENYSTKLRELGLDINDIIKFVEYARTAPIIRIMGGIYTYEVIERGYKEATKQEYLDSLLGVIDEDLFYLDDEYKSKFVVENSLYNKVVKTLKELSQEERGVYIFNKREKWPFLDRIIKDV